VEGLPVTANTARKSSGVVSTIFFVRSATNGALFMARP